MLTLDDLSQAVHAYQYRRASLDQFADWFRLASRTKFAAPAAVLDACFAIDAVLSRLEIEEISENELRGELANAILPFVYEKRQRNPILVRPDGKEKPWLAPKRPAEDLVLRV